MQRTGPHGYPGLPAVSLESFRIFRVPEWQEMPGIV
jgi:hypothetical protein